MPAKKWDRAPDSHVAAFAAALPADSMVERRQMFGYPCAFVNGNLFCGLHEANVCARLGAQAVADHVGAGRGKPFAPMAGRVMKEYLALPAADCADAARLAPWLLQAFGYTRALPAKAKRQATAKRAAPLAASGAKRK
jgi:TfoX N-terminal domain